MGNSFWYTDKHIVLFALIVMNQILVGNIASQVIIAYFYKFILPWTHEVSQLLLTAPFMTMTATSITINIAVNILISNLYPHTCSEPRLRTSYGSDINRNNIRYFIRPYNCHGFTVRLTFLVCPHSLITWLLNLLVSRNSLIQSIFNYIIV